VNFYLDGKTPLLIQCFLILTVYASLHNVGLWLNIFSIGQAAKGSAKIFNSKRGLQPKKFVNRCPKVLSQTDITLRVLLSTTTTHYYQFSRYS